MNEKVMVIGMSAETGSPLDSTEERELIRSAQRGDARAFEALFQRYHRRVLAAAARVVGPGQDALDVAQEVFLRLHRFLPRFRTDRNFFTWLYRIVINAGYDHLKREHRFRSVSLDEIPNEAAAVDEIRTLESEEFNRRILALAETLSHPLKTAFILRDVDEFSYGEIAEILDCRPGTVRSRVHQARRHLRDMIAMRHPEYFKGPSK